MISDYLIALFGCTVVTYLSRVAGFYAGGRELTLRTQRILAYVPIGAFVAIITLGVTDSPSEFDSRIPALIVSGALAYKAKPLWLCLVAGLAIYAAIELAI